MADSSSIPETQTTDDKLDFKKILPIFIIVLIDLLGLTIIIPLLPLYAVTFQADPLTVGLLSASYPVMQIIGAPVLGRLSDRFGRKPVLVVSQIGTLIGFLILGFASSLPLLFISRLIDGISGANVATAQAVITDNTTEKTRTQGLGLLGAAFGLGFIIGPVIAFVSLALSDNNYSVPAFVAVAFSFFSIILTITWLEESYPKEARENSAPDREGFNLNALFSALTHPGVGILLILMFAQQYAFGGLEYLLALFTLNRLGMGPQDNSLLFVYVGVLIVAVQGYFVGKWSKRFGERRIIYMGLLMLSIGMSLSAITPRVPFPWYEEANLLEQLRTDPAQSDSLSVEIPPETDRGTAGLVWILAAMIPVALGGGTLQPSINSLITKRIAPHEVGGMLGISTAMYSAANALTPAVNGLIFDQFGSTWPFLSGGVIMAILFVLSLILIKPGGEEKGSVSATT